MSRIETTGVVPLRPTTTPVGLPSRVLVGAAVLSIAALLVAIAGLVVDQRTITGVPGWLKPAKFGISIAVYCATLAWMLSLVRGHRRLVLVVACTTAAALGLELVLISMQVSRGTTSHFNTATPFDVTVYDAMGGLVALVFFAALATAVLLIRQHGLPPVLAVGIRGGLLIALLGMAEAGLMFANRAYSPEGGHTVGAVDGGPGLPLTGWSLDHGDLRVAHFVGLHALQALPILGWALQRYAPSLGQTVLARLLMIATTGYAGLVVLLAWEAERGLPLTGPDRSVIVVALVGLGLLAAASTVVVRTGPRRSA